MKIQIEVIVIVAIFLLLLFWTIWFRFITWMARKKYKEENDKSRYGEEKRRREIEGREPKIPSTTLGIPGPSQLDTGELLPTTTPDTVGEDINKSGKTSNSNGKVRFNPFRRRK